MSKLSDYPMISVVIPSLNQGQYIEETIFSVFGQQYPNLEIIVIDGGSTDNTVEILENYSSKLSYWHSRKDNGQADAINQGMNLSSGDILCWLNSDDMYLPGTLLDIGKRFYRSVDKYHLVYGAAVTINQIDGKLDGGAQTAAPFDAFKLTYFDYIVQPSSFWTRKLWYKTGELNTTYNYVLDWEWFIRASRITQFEYVPKFYSVYRFHPFHKSSNGGAERRKEIFNVIKSYSSEYWINLYAEADNFYNTLIFVKIPKRTLRLSLLFLRLLFKIKKIQDFRFVLLMFDF